MFRGEGCLLFQSGMKKYSMSFFFETYCVVDCDCNVMAQAQKPHFVFRLNRRVHLNRHGDVSSVDCWQPRCGPSAVVMLDTPCCEVVWRVLATHCIRHFPLHFPSRASTCAITFQLGCTKDEGRIFSRNVTICLSDYKVLRHRKRQVSFSLHCSGVVMLFGLMATVSPIRTYLLSYLLTYLLTYLLHGAESFLSS